MCKYCKEEFIYHDDDYDYYVPGECPTCGMADFNEITEEHCEDLESYSLTKYLNACEMDYYLTSVCKCGCEGDYLLVNVKNSIEEPNLFYKAWLYIANMEVDFDECPQCGNKKDLYYEVDTTEESVGVKIICPACHCIDKHEI